MYYIKSLILNFSNIVGEFMTLIVGATSKLDNLLIR